MRLSESFVNETEKTQKYTYPWKKFLLKQQSYSFYTKNFQNYTQCTLHKAAVLVLFHVFAS